MLIVPLGDANRRLVPLLLLLSAVGLLACVAQPTFGTLLAAIALLVVTTVAGQIVIRLGEIWPTTPPVAALSRPS